MARMRARLKRAAELCFALPVVIVLIVPALLLFGALMLRISGDE